MQDGCGIESRCGTVEGAPHPGGIERVGRDILVHTVAAIAAGWPPRFRASQGSARIFGAETDFDRVRYPDCRW
jgi:hypothetical protein